MKRLLIIVVLCFVSITAVNAQQSKDELLIQSILNDNIDSVKLLIKQGANANYETIYGITPLLFAVESGDTAIIKILLDSGAKIDVVPPYDPPAVSFAVINFRDTLLHFLLKKGANPDIVDESGHTPLYYAIRNGNYRGADELLLFGADPNKAVDNWTPLQLAAYYNDTLLINMLVYYGADVNKADSLGITPLHVAAQYNNELAAKTLINDSARLDLLTRDLASPVDFSIYSRSQKVFDYFMKQKPSFDNFVDGAFDAFQVAEFQKNYHARAALRKIGMHTPVFYPEYYLRFAQFINFNDYMFGLDVGVNELFTNISFSLGFYKRVFNKRIIIQQSEHVFYQYWESRWVVSLGAKKDFYLFNIGRVNNYFSLGANFLMSYAAYRGTLKTELSKEIAPLIGYSIDYKSFGADMLFTYLRKPMLHTREIYANIGVFYRLPTSPLRIRTKKKILY